jgi:hypothetical protein
LRKSISKVWLVEVVKVKAKWQSSKKEGQRNGVLYNFEQINR